MRVGRQEDLRNTVETRKFFSLLTLMGTGIQKREPTGKKYP
jgi:hypothetical protein